MATTSTAVLGADRDRGAGQRKGAERGDGGGSSRALDEGVVLKHRKTDVDVQGRDGDVMRV